MKRQISFGRSEFKPELFTPIKNEQFFPKPIGGLWCSTYTPDEEFLSSWHEWCYHQQFRSEQLEKYIILTIDSNARVYTIDSQFDLILLLNEIGIYDPEPHMYQHSHVPDFENAVNFYDVIYLTEKGQQETHMPWEARKFNLYGWDVESSLVLNPKIISHWESLKIK